MDHYLDEEIDGKIKLLERERASLVLELNGCHDDLLAVIETIADVDRIEKPRLKRKKEYHKKEIKKKEEEIRGINFKIDELTAQKHFPYLKHAFEILDFEKQFASYVQFDTEERTIYNLIVLKGISSYCGLKLLLHRIKKLPYLNPIKQIKPVVFNVTWPSCDNIWGQIATCLGINPYHDSIERRVTESIHQHLFHSNLLMTFENVHVYTEQEIQEITAYFWLRFLELSKGREPGYRLFLCLTSEDAEKSLCENVFCEDGSPIQSNTFVSLPSTEFVTPDYIKSEWFIKIISIHEMFDKLRNGIFPVAVNEPFTVSGKLTVLQDHYTIVVNGKKVTLSQKESIEIHNGEICLIEEGFPILINDKIAINKNGEPIESIINKIGAFFGHYDIYSKLIES